jgi:hypothetical protein
MAEYPSPVVPGQKQRRLPPCVAMVLLLLLGGCATGSISGKDMAGEPTAYATVVKEPDPLLLGCHMRPRPADYHRPNSYSYCLVRKGDKYAVYYHWRDGKTMAEHQGWMPFTIDGDRLISDSDPSIYRVRQGQVWQEYPGHDKPFRMIPY